MFGQGNTSILLSSFQCNGSEANLTSCNYTAMSVDCGHQREAGVTCASCINGNVRLASGNSLKGQVEVCGNQQWNTVCDSMFNDEAAGVVCRQLGHSQFGEQVILYTQYRTVQLYNTGIGQYLYRIQVIVLCVLERINTFSCVTLHSN